MASVPPCYSPISAISSYLHPPVLADLRPFWDLSKHTTAQASYTSNRFAVLAVEMDTGKKSLADVCSRLYICATGLQMSHWDTGMHLKTKHLIKIRFPVESARCRHINFILVFNLIFLTKP